MLRLVCTGDPCAPQLVGHRGRGVLTIGCPAGCGMTGLVRRAERRFSLG